MLRTYDKNELQEHDISLQIWPNQILYTVCNEVPSTADIPYIAQKMTKIMLENDGIGIAAPQCNLPIRMFVVMEPEETDHVVFVNPQLSQLQGVSIEAEGCLSLPGIGGKVKRASRLFVTAKDIEGKKFQITAKGKLARVIQHENDHLNGRLIIDKFKGIDKKNLNRRLQGIQERYHAQ